MDIDRSVLGDEWDGLLVFVLNDEHGRQQVFATMKAAIEAAVESHVVGTIDVHTICAYGGTN